MKMKKVLAVVMAFCMVAGTMSYGAPVIAHAVTAQLEDPDGEPSWYLLDTSSGVLTFKGKVDADELRHLKLNLTVLSIKTEDGTVFPEDCSSLFSSFIRCTSIDLSKADTSNVTNMSGMFSGLNDLKELDISSFDTRNVTDMSRMFSYCYRLETLDVSKFDTSKVTDMSNMFYCCHSLSSLDLKNFDTGEVTNMSEMFYLCNGLSTLDVSNFNTSNVTDMSDMFRSCNKLNSLDVSGFDTGNVTSMNSMFTGCSSLTTLDVSGFDISKVTNIDYMFNNCTELKTIFLGDKFTSIPQIAYLPNGDGWVNAKAPTTVISGNGEFAEIVNNGKNTYKRLPIKEEAKPTYPTNIKVEYSEKYNQVRFTWNKVDGADRYGIAVYLAGKWRIQTQDITDTVYTSPKNLTPGKTYKVAIAARVNGKWDTANAIKNAVTVTIERQPKLVNN
jgi:surface protein